MVLRINIYRHRKFMSSVNIISETRQYFAKIKVASCSILYVCNIRPKQPSGFPGKYWNSRTSYNSNKIIYIDIYIYLCKSFFKRSNSSRILYVPGSRDSLLIFLTILPLVCPCYAIFLLRELIIISSCYPNDILTCYLISMDMPSHGL